jgi:hypothetical protein
LAAECELGPEVFGTVDNLNFSGYNCGYLSEIVELVDRYSDEGVDFYNENISGLRDSLYQEIGFQFCDDWIFNVGIKNGRLICIDFGELQ